MRPLDLARRLLASDQHDAERAPALGHVEENLLDRARPLARRVLVELVEHDELQRSGRAGALLGLERASQQHADDEPLRTIVEVVDVDDRDLVVERNRVLVGPVDVGPDEMLHVTRRTVDPAQERVDGAHRDRAPGPRAQLAVFGEHLLFDDLDEFVEVAHDLAVEAHGAVDRVAVITGGALQFGGHVVHDHRVLLAIVFGVGKEERQQLLVAEVVDRPEEAPHAQRAARDIGSGDPHLVAPRRRPHPTLPNSSAGSPSAR